VKEKNLENFVEFLGGVPDREMLEYYRNSDLLVNLTPAGSFDKALLEAMASGCLVLTSNDSFLNILGNKYLFKEKDLQNLAGKIIQ